MSPMRQVGPKERTSTVPDQEEEAGVRDLPPTCTAAAGRCLYALQAALPHLSPFSPASLLSTSWDQPVAGSGRRSTGEDV